MSTSFYGADKICRNGAVLWQITEMKVQNFGRLGSQTLSYPSLLVLQRCLERSYSIVTRECFISSRRCSSDKFWFCFVSWRIGVLQDLGTELRQWFPASCETVLHRRDASSNVLSLCCVIFRCCGEACQYCLFSHVFTQWSSLATPWLFAFILHVNPVQICFCFSYYLKLYFFYEWHL